MSCSSVYLEEEVWLGVYYINMSSRKCSTYWKMCLGAVTLKRQVFCKFFPPALKDALGYWQL